MISPLFSSGTPAIPIGLLRVGRISPVVQGIKDASMQLIDDPLSHKVPSFPKLSEFVRNFSKTTGRSLTLLMVWRPSHADVF